MARRLKNFELMWNAYPNPGGGSSAAKKTIGGNVDADWITNTCVIRVCRSFNYANHRIPRRRQGLNTVSGADGLRYAFRVSEFRRYLTDVYGTPALSHRYPEPGGPVPEGFLRRQGVICFVVRGWSDATGHFDLWRDDDCIHTPYFHKASEVYLWEVSSTVSLVRPRPPVYRISSSVGEGGANSEEDVRIVQTLLSENGVDPGAIDGDCGPKTIRAIRTFQARFLTQPDGRVDLDGRTWRELVQLG